MFSANRCNSLMSSIDPRIKLIANNELARVEDFRSMVIIPRLIRICCDEMGPDHEKCNGSCQELT